MDHRTAISLLFASRLVDKYDTWYRQRHPITDDVFFPSAEEYFAFLTHLYDTEEFYSPLDLNLPTETVLKTASVCGHALHPGDLRQDTTHCCICEMTETVMRVSRVYRLLMLLHEQDEIDYIKSKTQQIWQAEHKHWVKVVYNFDMVATDEEEWDARAFENDDVNLIEAADSHSASNCLEMAWAVPFLDGAAAPFIPRRAINAQKPPAMAGKTSLEATEEGSPNTWLKPMKHVNFAQDVTEYEPRTPVEFRRGSPTYEPGRHACPQPGGWNNFHTVTAEMDVDSESDSSDEEGESDSSVDSSADEEQGDDPVPLFVNDHFIHGGQVTPTHTPMAVQGGQGGDASTSSSSRRRSRAEFETTTTVLVPTEDVPESTTKRPRK